jgi:hypothetical protein
VEDIGDLSTFAAYETADMRSTSLSPDLLVLDKKLTPEELKSLISRK